MANDLIKKAFIEEEFSDDQILELEKCMNDPIYFMENYVKVQHPTRGSVPFKLYPYQREMVNTINSNRMSILMLSRQSGKTATSSAYLLWWAIFKDDQTILVASKGMAHAIEIMDRIRFAYEELPSWLKPGCKAYNKSTIEFDNGSKVISQATSGKTGRGYSISLLYCDELAFISKNIQDEMWSSIFPTLATGGRCIISSTPNGDGDLFATLWRGSILKTNQFANYSATWETHPERDDEWKNMMIGSIGELLFRQECCNEFLSSDPLLISSLKMQTFKTIPALREQGMFRFWREPDPTKTYIVGCDVASGTGSDFSTISVFEFPSLIQMAELRSNTINIPQLYGRLKWIVNYLSTPAERNRTIPEVYWSFENNGLGHAIIALYQNDESPPMGELINADLKQIGVNTNGKTKILACLQFKNLVERNKNPLTVNSDLLLAEMKNYVQSGGSYAAKTGATDDLISSVLVCLQIIKKMSEFDENAHKITYQYDEVNRGLDNDGNFVEEDVDANEPFGIF